MWDYSVYFRSGSKSSSGKVEIRLFPRLWLGLEQETSAYLHNFGHPLNFAVDYLAHFVFYEKDKETVTCLPLPVCACISLYAHTARVCVCVSCLIHFCPVEQLFFFSFYSFSLKQADRPGRPGSLPQGYLKEMPLCCGREEIWKRP